MKQKLSINEIIKREKRCRALCQDTMCDWDFAHDNGQNPDATGIARNYVEHFDELRKEGVGLFLYGGAGSGKSFVAAQIVNALTDQGYRCLFTAMGTVMIELQTLSFENRRNYLFQLCDKDLLVLDDFGSEMETAYSNQILTQIVNICHSKSIPIIVTTPYHQDVLTRESTNPKRLLSVTRLLQRSIPYTVMMPGERRSRMLQQKQMSEALLKGKNYAAQQALALQ